MEWIYLREKVKQRPIDRFLGNLKLIAKPFQILGAGFLAFRATVYGLDLFPILGKLDGGFIFALGVLGFGFFAVVFYYVSDVLLELIFPINYRKYVYSQNKPFYDFIENIYKNNKTVNFQDMDSLQWFVVACGELNSGINKVFIRMFSYGEINKKEEVAPSIVNEKLFTIEGECEPDIVMEKAFLSFINEILMMKEQNLSVFVCQKTFRKSDIEKIGYEEKFIPTENMGYSYKTNGIDTVIYFLSKWEVENREPIYYFYSLNMKKRSDKIIEWDILYSFLYKNTYNKLGKGEVDFNHFVLESVYVDINSKDSDILKKNGSIEHALDINHRHERHSHLPIFESVFERSLNRAVFELRNTSTKSSSSSEETPRSFVVDLN